jgi:cytochrome c oxidase cbb3-type subunit III
VAELERDPHTGYLTTGHEWNGIKELNSPVPIAVYVFIFVTHLFALVYWVLMPTWPLLTTYTKGLLGHNDRVAVGRSVKEAEQDRANWTDRIAAESYTSIQADARLMLRVRETGRTLFGDNCAACHGREARGAKRFPDLTTDFWLWGGTPEAVAETIRVGINSTHPNGRVSQMLAFGREGVLKHNEIESVVTYVRYLSESDPNKPMPETLKAGAAVFATNCASCHGEDAKGKLDVGAPNLTGTRWIYGSDAETIYNTVWGGRRGYMPSWENRLSAIERKILVLYLLDLRGRKP